MTIEEDELRREDAKKRLGKDKKKTENGTMNYKFKAVMIPPPQKKMQSEPVEVS